MKKLDLKKSTIIKLNNLSFIKGGADGTIVGAGKPQCEETSKVIVIKPPE